MQLFLRTVKQNRWIKDERVQLLLDEDDIPADPLADLSTKSGRLSVWKVKEDRSNLERIVRAVAIGKEKLDHAGWVLFDSTALEKAKIEIVDEAGNTKDSGANFWHADLVLTGNKMIALTKAILRGGRSGTVLKNRLAELIEEGIRAQQLPEEVKRLLPGNKK